MCIRDRFRTWEPDAPELHTDPVVRGYGLDKLARLVRWFATPMLICALVILALPLWLLLAWDEPVLSLVTGSGDNLFLCILSEWIAIYMSFRSFSSFFALRRRLRAGKEPRRSGWRCSARINAACLAGSFILVALSFAVLAAGRGMRWEGETATVNRPFPDFALEELEAVSYTHLDVYKRQFPLDTVAPCWEITWWMQACRVEFSIKLIS